MEGWIKLHRQLTDHWVWDDKPYSKGQAWVDMLLMANHADKKIMIGGKPFQIEQGAFVTSENKLMERWGWSKSKVRSFLSSLQNDSMIVKKTDKKKTTINIVNYSVFQFLETKKEPQKDQKKTTERPLKDRNKNVKNEKNVNKYIKDIVPTGTSPGKTTEEPTGTSPGQATENAVTGTSPDCTDYDCQCVVDYLNLKAGTSFRSSSKDTRKHIRARFNEGYTLEDFYRVIDVKCEEWGDAPVGEGKDMRPYLRPSTLFGTKFEVYLNQKSSGKRAAKNRFINFPQRDNAGLFERIERMGCAYEQGGNKKDGKKE